PCRIVLDLEFVLERALLHEDRIGDDVAVQLELLAAPRLLIDHDLVDVLVVLGPLAQRRPQHAGEGEHEHERGRADLDISMCHKDFPESTSPKQSIASPAGLQGSSRPETRADQSGSRFRRRISVMTASTTRSQRTAWN